VATGSAQRRMSHAPVIGCAPVRGLQMYFESRGSGEVPLIVTHGGFGRTTAFGGLLDELAQRRRVVAIELQGHGHTPDLDREFSYEAFGDDIAALVEYVGAPCADLFGYSLGAGASLRCAIQHPQRVRRLALLAFPCRRDGWFPEVLAGMEQVGAGAAEQMRRSPLFDSYAEVAPDPGGFDALMKKTGALLRRPYDWTEEVRRLAGPTLLVYADADSIPPSHAAEFFALVGGGQRDAGWDGSLAPESHLAILPGRTHYDIAGAPGLAGILEGFLS
jgi:pimeloyl-ACP methyl ester carboxylesterase